MKNSSFYSSLEAFLCNWTHDVSSPGGLDSHLMLSYVVFIGRRFL